MTRISLGMQSAVPHVLAVLDRVHQPGRPAACARWARAAGFEHVSLDLIYGTPGESDADWRESLEAALAAEPDHISAYALIVEEGTRLAARIRRGEIPPPDDDAMADRYLAADDLLAAAGLHWYEISNWAAGPEARCRHNLLYWASGNWWGVGPGAHSHVGGTRWWNVRHPSAYAARVSAGESPAQATGDFDRTRTPSRTDPAAAPAFRRAARVTELDRAGGRRPPRPRSRTGWPTRRRTRPGGWSSPGGDGCSPTLVIRGLTGST